MVSKVGWVRCKHLRPEVSAMVPPNGYTYSLPPGNQGAVERHNEIRKYFQA